MSRFSIAEFVEKTKQKDRGEGLFELEGDRLLEVNLDGTGCLVAIGDRDLCLLRL